MKDFSLRNLVLFLVIGLISCSGDTKKVPVYAYFNPIEENLLSPTYFSTFLNYPNDWSRLGFKAKPFKVEYLNSRRYEIVFDTLGSIVSFHSELQKVNQLEINLYGFNYDEESRLVSITKREDVVRGKKLHEGKVHPTVDFFDFAPNKKPLYGKFYKTDSKKTKQDHLVQYHYSEKGICKNMNAVKNNLDKDESKKLFCDVTSDEKGLPILIQVQNVSLIGRHEGERTLYPKYSSGKLTSIMEKSVILHTPIDSVISESIYSYNSKGDIESWNYKESIYPQNTYTEFHLKFEYKYDKYDNWTEKQISGLYEYLNAVANNAFVTDYEIHKEPNEGVGVGKLVLRRSILYY